MSGLSWPIRQRPMITYPFYRLATIGWANPLLRQTIALFGADPREPITLDLSQLTFVDAFGVTYLAACFNNCVSANREAWVLPPKDGGVNEYLLDVGLYEEAGIGEDFRPRKASRSRVDLVHVSELEPGFVDHLLDFLENAQPFAPGLRPSIRMALLELVQNFAEHAGSPGGAWISGQYHPFTKAKIPRVTLCVLDLGIGIARKLRTVRRYRRNRDNRLVELSTHEGVSSAGNGSRGQGLSVIRQFVRANGGDMTILANRGRVKFRADRRPTPQRMDCEFPGSAVFLSLVPTQRGLYVLD